MPLVLGSQAITLPSDTTANRPGSPAVGMMRHSSSTTFLEHYNAQGWANPVAQDIARRSLLLHWDPSTYTAGTNNTWTDSVNSQTLTLSGTTRKTSTYSIAPNDPNTAATWVGSNYASAIFGTGAFTIEVWIYIPFTTTDNTNWGYIAGKSNFWDAGSYGLYILSNGQNIGFHTTNTPGLEINLTTSGLGAGWKHIVGVRSTTGRKLYVNGVLRGSDSTVDNITSTQALCFGNDSGRGYSAKTYEFGSFRIYNTDLSAEEVMQNYQFEAQRYTGVGLTSTNPAIHANTIKAWNPEAKNGFYWIQAPGMANPARVWCDMVTEGGGWMRFWWYGRYEIDGTSPSSYPSASAFGTADISTLSYDATSGFGRIPSGVTARQFMAKGSSGAGGDANNNKQTKADPLGYATWTFNGSNTSNAVLASMQSGTTSRNSNQTDWPPDQYVNSGGTVTVTSLLVPAYTGENYPGTMYDSWYYDSSNGGGFNSFQLDDDTGFYNTAIGAGQDGSGNQGVDFFSGTLVSVSNTSVLVLYWR